MLANKVVKDNENRFPLSRKDLAGVFVGLGIVFVSVIAMMVSDYYSDKQSNDAIKATAIYTNNTLSFLKAKALQPDQQIVINASLIPPGSTILINPDNITGTISSLDGPIVIGNNTK